MNLTKINKIFDTWHDQFKWIDSIQVKWKGLQGTLVHAGTVACHPVVFITNLAL